MTLSIAHLNSLKWITAAAIGFTVSVVSLNAQAGEIRKPKEEIRSVYLVKYRVNDKIRYAKKSVGKVKKVSASRYRNSNPYVCTPSGFGQKARCYNAGVFKRPDA
ncbi:hypothetical protein [Phyllobacterium sp. K27]